jgi:hypothetical protein
MNVQTKVAVPPPGAIFWAWLVVPPAQLSAPVGSGGFVEEVCAVAPAPFVATDWKSATTLIPTFAKLVTVMSRMISSAE